MKPWCKAVRAQDREARLSSSANIGADWHAVATIIGNVPHIWSGERWD